MMVLVPVLSMVRLPLPSTVKRLSTVLSVLVKRSCSVAERISNLASGVESPIPTFPEGSIIKGVVSEAWSFTTKELPSPTLVTDKGTAVEVARVLMPRIVPPVVAAEVSPNVKAVFPVAARAQFQVWGLLPLAMVLDPVAAVIAESALEPEATVSQVKFPEPSFLRKVLTAPCTVGHE